MNAPDFAFPPEEAIRTMHRRLIELYGGAPGIRDDGAIEAALARPQNLLTYREIPPDIIELAAALSYSIGRVRHPFIDGNKRVAFAVLLVALDLNGLALDAPESEAAQTMTAVASGAITEAEFVEWIRRASVEI